MRAVITTKTIKYTIDLYLSGNYTQKMVADLAGISYSAARRIITLSPPYDFFKQELSAQKLKKLLEIRDRRKLKPGDIDHIKNGLLKGHSVSDISKAIGVSRTHIYRLARGTYRCIR